MNREVLAISIDNHEDLGLALKKKESIWGAWSGVVLSIIFLVINIIGYGLFKEENQILTYLDTICNGIFAYLIGCYIGRTCLYITIFKSSKTRARQITTLTLFKCKSSGF